MLFPVVCSLSALADTVLLSGQPMAGRERKTFSETRYMTYDTVGLLVVQNKQLSSCRGMNLLYETECLTYLYFKKRKEVRRGGVIEREKRRKAISLALQIGK